MLFRSEEVVDQLLALHPLHGDGLEVYDEHLRTHRTIYVVVAHIVNDLRGFAAFNRGKQAGAYIGACPKCKIRGRAKKLVGAMKYPGACHIGSDISIRRRFKLHHAQTVEVRGLAEGNTVRHCQFRDSGQGRQRVGVRIGAEARHTQLAANTFAGMETDVVEL